MTSKELYKRFISLCQKWPKDETKVGRDYADYLRIQVGKHFPHGELGQVGNAKAVEASLSSLERLSNNLYHNENPLKRSSASGLEAWACKDSISNEGIRLIQEDGESTLINRLKTVLGVKFLSTKSDYKVADELEAKASLPKQDNKNESKT